MTSTIQRDGVTLAYDETGAGGPPLLFVHGFGGDARHFAAQLEHFRGTRRCVALDRRGHGRSDKPDGPYTIPAIAEEVAWTARELGLDRPVLVVHSMGAIGFELAARDPDLLSALVILDAPVLPPPPVLAQFEQLLAGLRTPAYAEVIGHVCDTLIYLPTDDRARRRALHDAMLETPQHVLAATWEGFLRYDVRPAARRCTLPVLYVGSVMPVDEAAMRELMPHVVIGRTVGAGHMHQTEVPEQVDAMIGRFLANAGL